VRQHRAFRTAVGQVTASLGSDCSVAHHVVCGLALLFWVLCVCRTQQPCYLGCPCRGCFGGMPSTSVTRAAKVARLLCLTTVVRGVFVLPHAQPVLRIALAASWFVGCWRASPWHCAACCVCCVPPVLCLVLGLLEGSAAVGMAGAILQAW
jgi:hypothetical protein